MNKLLTKYGEQINENNVLTEYPRPLMKRKSYLSLNGYWGFAITKNKEKPNFSEKILVPFSPESMLSGVNKTLMPDEYAHYQKVIDLDESYIDDVTYLYFGAVDQEVEVWINDNYAFKHIGGFTPFKIDITQYLTSTQLKIYLRVKDVTNTSYLTIGKQRLKPKGIWYTPQSGVWQPVWLESVPEIYFLDIKIIPNFDESSLTINFEQNKEAMKDIIILYNGKEIANSKTNTNNITIDISPLHPWTPEHPNLYTLKLIMGRDEIDSYFAMRKFSKEKDKNGIMRFFLNNKPYFLTGVLDQGYYSDGLLTPPSDQAMIDDIKLMKNMGFNMLRKHIKIEPLRWYYHCDRLGMIVWQDMINGGSRKDILFHGILGMLNIHIKDKHYWLFGRKNKNGRKMYENELKKMIDYLKNVPSLAVWGPFNEAWGQFDAKRIGQEVKNMDPSRLVDHASGWSDQKSGDFCSKHIYFTKIKFKAKDGKKRINALTEFGGYSLTIPNHSYDETKTFGYKKFDDKKALQNAVVDLYNNQIIPNLDKGLSALVYTQLSDVENEVNGLVTYDRKVVKFDENVIRKMNEDLINKFDEIMK
jgi:beta-galactosidase/beta-glucuronidase